MAGSPVFAVRQWIADSLADLAAFDGVSVTPAWVSGARDAERVYSRQGRFTQEVAAIHGGTVHRNENGTFQQIIRVEGVGLTLEETCLRALALGQAFEEWLAANRNPNAGLTTPVLPGVQVVDTEGPGGIDDMFNEAGSLVYVSYTIRYKARLSED